MPAAHVQASGSPLGFASPQAGTQQQLPGFQPLQGFAEPARDQFVVTHSMVIPEADWEAAFAPAKPAKVRTCSFQQCRSASQEDRYAWLEDQRRRKIPDFLAPDSDKYYSPLWLIWMILVAGCRSKGRTHRAGELSFYPELASLLEGPKARIIRVQCYSDCSRGAARDLEQ